MVNRTMNIQVRTKGKHPLQWIREVSTRIYPEMQNEILLSAEATAEIMKRILEGSGYKLEKLANAINVDVLSSTGGIHIGIGNIFTFPVGQTSGVSYYEWFNDGFKVTQANIGYFGDNFNPPISGASGEKWHHTGKGSGFFYMKPNKIIEPLRFVELGHEALVRHIEKQLIKFNRNLEQAGK